jgi:hypothetical protein
VREIPAKGKLREQEAVEGETAGCRGEVGQGREGEVVSAVTMASALSHWVWPAERFRPGNIGRWYRLRCDDASI